jgi:hypothetical protein
MKESFQYVDCRAKKKKRQGKQGKRRTNGKEKGDTRPPHEDLVVETGSEGDDGKVGDEGANGGCGGEEADSVADLGAGKVVGHEGRAETQGGGDCKAGKKIKMRRVSLCAEKETSKRRRRR